MDRGAWQAAVYGVARVGYNSVTKQQQYGCEHWSDGGQGGRETLSLSIFITISDHVIILLVLNIQN